MWTPIARRPHFRTSTIYDQPDHAFHLPLFLNPYRTCRERWKHWLFQGLPITSRPNAHENQLRYPLKHVEYVAYSKRYCIPAVIIICSSRMQNNVDRSSLKAMERTFSTGQLISPSIFTGRAIWSDFQTTSPIARNVQFWPSKNRSTSSTWSRH